MEYRWSVGGLDQSGGVVARDTPRWQREHRFRKPVKEVLSGTR
jgi:hypothetical protein